MNPVSLYITTSRLVFQSGGGPGGTDSGGGSHGSAAASSNFTDLNRLLPYLRKSLSCAVCCRLLLEPHTPAELNCQHHVCRGCVGERKKLKPSCGSCKDYNRYVENTQLRMLLQCYKSICEYIKTKPFFAEIRRQATALNGISMTVLGTGSGPGGGGGGVGEVGATATTTSVGPSLSVPSNLWELIEEGAHFQDNYRCSSGLTKSAYSILPCIYPAPTVSSSVPSPQPLPAAGHHQGQQMIITSSTGGVGGVAQMQAKVHPGAAGVGAGSEASTASYTVTSALPDTVQTHQHQQQQQQQIVVQSGGGGRQTQHHQQQQQQQKEIKFRSAPIKTVSNGSTMYSVLYAGNGNKITIKRKTDPPHVQRRATIHTLDKDGQLKLAKTLAENNSTVTAAAASSSVVGFKMPSVQTTTATLAAAASSGVQGAAIGSASGSAAAAAAAAAAANNSKQSAKQLLKRRGCRCGNATATPGKLTCCGQRCPCYVDSKSCVDCKCRGCRNPHRADGMKVRPHIPELQNLEINLHNANASEALSTATTTVLAPQQSTSEVPPSVINAGTATTTTMLQQQQQPSGLTLVSTGGKGLSQINLLGSTTGVAGTTTPGGSTLKITPTSLANVLNSTANQLVSTSHDGIGLGPSAGLLDASGFSYLTPGSLDVMTSVAGAATTTTMMGGAPPQYSAVPGTSLANGGTIHVVNVYTTHLGDVSCSPTLSNMIRTDSALNSLLTHKPPEALLTQQGPVTPLHAGLQTLATTPTLLGHSLFNPAAAVTSAATVLPSSLPTADVTAASIVTTGPGGAAEIVGDVGTIDISDQLDLAGASLITIDGTALDDRLHDAGDV